MPADINLDEFKKNVCDGYDAYVILRKLLGGYEGKRILGLGCGVARTEKEHKYFSEYNISGIYYPAVEHGISKRGRIVYGVDIDFLEKSKKYLKEFKKSTGIIPVPGNITDIGEILKGEEFDGIISTSFLGMPIDGYLKEINIKIMKDLFSLTAHDGYHCHYKVQGEEFKITEEALKDIGFNVLNFFKKRGEGLDSILILHKD